MTQKDIELILLRQWASHLSMPIFLTGADGELLFYNEPAEALIGLRFDEAGEMPASLIARIFKTKNADGTPMTADQLPLTVALQQRRPSHRVVRFEGLDGVSRVVEVTAVPITAQGERNLGAVVFFWEAAGA
jgi:PAS domain-containing protein